MATKRCLRCNKTKPLKEFAKDRNRKDGRQPYCRLCWKEYKADWQKNHPEQYKESKRREKLKAKYGITLNKYNEILQSQNNVCAACGKPCPTGNRLAVDHDHKTGKVRGLLCVNCNMALGYVQDNSDLLRRLANYLEKHGIGVRQ